MFCTIINDCTDSNVVGRQGSRVASLLGVTPTYVGVGSVGLVHENEFLPAELEAAGCLVDVLDAGEGREGLVLVNIANRHGKGKKWPNGTPFGYFYYKNTLVLSSIDGTALSLVKKLAVTSEIQLLDVPAVMNYFVESGTYPVDVCEHVKSTQFRSFDFTPRVGAFLIQGGRVPNEKIKLEEIYDVGSVVWYVDNFGNCKTTLLESEVEFEAGKVINSRWGELTCYSRLKDVPNGVRALIVGSSGLEEKRFLEIIVQGRSAQQELGIGVGDRIF